MRSILVLVAIAVILAVVCLYLGCACLLVAAGVTGMATDGATFVENLRHLLMAGLGAFMLVVAVDVSR